MGRDLNDVLVFTAVVETGSFTAAADALGLPASSVSRRVARLEDRLGRKLLYRTTRKVSLTEAGRHYYDRTARIRTQLEEAERAVASLADAPQGLIRVTAPPADLQLLWPPLEAFLAGAPQVRLELALTGEPVDLIARGIDVALRGGTPPDSHEYTAKLLVDMGFFLAASHAYLEANGEPKSAADLLRHPRIVVDHFPPWHLQTKDGPVLIDTPPRLVVDRPDYAIAAIQAGFGIGMLVGRLDQPWPDGLREVLPGSLPFKGPLWAVYPTSHATAAVRALVSHLEEAFSGPDLGGSSAVPGT